MKKIVLHLVVLLACSNLFGQEDYYIGDLDKKYLPPKSSIFYTDNEVSADKNTINNCIKFDLGLLARGVGAFEYERRLYKKLSIVGGLGLVLYNDIFGTGILNFDETDTYLLNVELESYSIFYKAALRYNSDDICDGGYIESGFRAYSNKSQIDLDEEFPFSDPPYGLRSFENKFRDVFVTLGYNIGYDKFYWDWYIGALYRLPSVVLFDEIGLTSTSGASTTFITTEIQEDPVVMMQLGVRFGLVF